jgi:hypothetical protein
MHLLRPAAAAAVGGLGYQPHAPLLLVHLTAQGTLVLQVWREHRHKGGHLRWRAPRHHRLRHHLLLLLLLVGHEPCDRRVRPAAKLLLLLLLHLWQPRLQVAARGAGVGHLQRVAKTRGHTPQPLRRLLLQSPTTRPWCTAWRQ